MQPRRVDDRAAMRRQVSGSLQAGRSDRSRCGGRLHHTGYGTATRRSDRQRDEEGAVAEGDLVAGADAGGADEAPAVEAGAVEGAEVDDDPVVVLAAELGVDAGDGEVGQ